MSNPFYEAIGKRATAEVIKDSEARSEKQLRFMVRVPAGPTTTIWLGLIKHLLTVARMSVRTEISRGPKANWTIDVSKHYFVTPEGDLRYGWRIIVQSNLMEMALADLGQAIYEAPAQAAQIEEVRLHGSPNRRVGGLMGHVNVGAAAHLSR